MDTIKSREQLEYEVTQLLHILHFIQWFPKAPTPTLQYSSLRLSFFVFSFQDYLFNHVSFFSWCVFSGIMGSFITHDFSCLSRVGLLVHDRTDTILSSYTFKSHYLLTESNRAELMKLPMIPSSSSATKKNIGKGKIMFSWFM